MKKAFTLIELLVVITIIVVLLALLTPALDKAIYQAELAVCGANLKALGGGVTMYAMDSQRRYPYRRNTLEGNAHLSEISPGAPEWDFRPFLRQSFALKTLNCPLTEAIDVEGSNPDSLLFVPYGLGVGWQWRDYEFQESAMARMGDRFTWTETDGRVHRFDLLAYDWNDSASNDTFVQSTHPDDAGMMQQLHHQDEPSPWLPSVNGISAQYATLSWWERSDSEDRGLLDRNFAHADGSVRRIGGIDMNDDRFIEAPVYSANRGDFPARRTFLPRN